MPGYIMRLLAAAGEWATQTWWGTTITTTTTTTIISSVLLSALLAVATVLWLRNSLMKHSPHNNNKQPLPSSQAQTTTEESSTPLPSSSLSVAKKTMSVNFHFLRKCNYACGFCFHTATSFYVLDEAKAKKGLARLIDFGLGKINFSGGEPFLKPKLLGAMCEFVKTYSNNTVKVSIVSNGSRIRRSWMEKFAQHVDYLAVSCDSFNHDTNVRIGRGTSSNPTVNATNTTSSSRRAVVIDSPSAQERPRTQMEVLREVAGLCQEFGVDLRLNTVVNAYNKDEDMAEHVLALEPKRWKVFQCLLLDGENQGKDALRHAETFVVSDEDFQAFVDRHRASGCDPIGESNDVMKDSYLILDEQMRFLRCKEGGKVPGKSLLDDGGVPEALDWVKREHGFDEASYQERRGDYWREQEEEEEEASELGSTGGGGASPLSSSSPCSSLSSSTSSLECGAGAAPAPCDIEDMGPLLKRSLSSDACHNGR